MKKLVNSETSIEENRHQQRPKNPSTLENGNKRLHSITEEMFKRLTSRFLLLHIKVTA